MHTDDVLNATGSDFCYAYRELQLQTTYEQMQNYCTRMRDLFRPLAKNFSEEKNNIWVLRHYLAIKFATAASLLAGSAAYASERNLLLAVPYFNYYATFNACRAYLFTCPQVEWRGEATIKMTHNKILNQTSEYMRTLDANRFAAWRQQLATLQRYRELYSYSFPASGPEFAGVEAFNPEGATALARLIAELASLNTECFQGVLKKYASPDLRVSPLSDQSWAYAYKLAGTEVVDHDDRYRFGKFLSGWRTVSTLEVMTSDGLMDDLYGSWTSQQDDVGADWYDPDKYSDLVLAL